MSLEFALQLTQRSVSICLFLFGFEFYFLGQNKSFLKIWTYQNLKSDLQEGMPFPVQMIEFLFSEKYLKYLGLIQILCSVIYFFRSSVLILCILFFIHLINTIRFRGTFNGGSDMMIFVLLTGSIISATAPPEFQKLGLIYIAIHAGYSYIKSGFAKIIQPDWRNGFALSTFLERSQFVNVRQKATWLKSKESFCQWLCWGIFIFELSFVLLPFFSHLINIYLVAAVLFHFSIYLMFGLNRFFWAWLSAWPAIYFTVGHSL